MNLRSRKLSMAGPSFAPPDIVQCPHPTLPQLDERAKLTDRSRGGPVEAGMWLCPNKAEHGRNVYWKNNPSNNFLLNLPPLFCQGCRRVNPRGYRWNTMMFEVRGIPLDCLVHDQGDYNTCVVHAILAAMNFARKIKAAHEYAYFVGQPLSVRSVFAKFTELFQDVFGHEEGPAKALVLERERCIIHILQKYGVKYSAPSRTKKVGAETQGVLKMGPVFRVSATDIELIIRLLAGGYPLFCGSNIGRRFHLTSGDEIYDAGEAAGDDNHCVLLIGSGVLNYPGNPIPTDGNRHALSTWPPMNPSTQAKGPRIHLRGRNSWNVTAHGKSSRDGLGGDFNFWADQIEDTDVWGISEVLDA
ncbi:hypothetical protein ACQJBY_031466 [Aegilops geniculata]